MSVLLSLFWLLVLIGTMILIHELGHFWAARIFKVRVDVFSIGFGPRLFGFKRGDTDYRFSAVLFGGYVKMAGEQPGEAVQDDPGAFFGKPRWQRLIIAAAGPFMNVVLAIGLLTGLFMVRFEHMGEAVVGKVVAGSPADLAGVKAGDKFLEVEGRKNPNWLDVVTAELPNAGRSLDVRVMRGKQELHFSVVPKLEENTGIARAGWEQNGEVFVGSVSPGKPAAQAGLQAGDLLLAINGKPIQSFYTLQEVIQPGQGKPVTIDYSRAGVKRTATMSPVMSGDDGKPRYMIGVTNSPGVTVEKLSLGAAFGESLRYNERYATVIVQFLRGLVERRMSAKAISGPIGIAGEAKAAAQQGWFSFMGLMAMVSLNLAIFNMLPVPILDGGMILLLMIEMLLGRDVSMAVKEGMLKIGFVFLMAVVVFVIYNDISKVMTQG